MKNPNNDAQLLSAAAQLLGRGEALQARKICEALVAKLQRSPEAFHLLGIAQLQTGDLDNAIRSMRRAVQLAPNNSDYIVNLATALKKSGAFDASIEAYRHILAINPRYIGAYRGLALLHFDRKEPAKSLEILQAAPHDAECLVIRSLVEGQLERWQDAADSARAAVAASPTLYDAYLALGDALLMLRQREEAIAAYEASLKYNPKGDVYFGNIIADARLCIGLSNALSHFDVLEVNPDPHFVQLISEQFQPESQAALTVVFFHASSGTKHPFSDMRKKTNAADVDYKQVLSVACASARKSNPQANVVVITDMATDLSGLPEYASIVRLPLKTEWLMHSRMSSYLAVASIGLRGPIAFLDADVCLNRDFHPVFDANFEIGLTYRQEPAFAHMPINEGVILAASGDCAARFFGKTLALYDFIAQQDCVATRYEGFDVRRWRGGQLALAAFVDWAVPPFVKEDVTINGLKCKFLPCDTHNYVVGPDYDHSRLKEKWALHFKGAAKTSMAAHVYALTGEGRPEKS